MALRGGSDAATTAQATPYGHSPPSKILDFLFIGSVSDATNAEFIRRENIVTILNVSREEYWSVNDNVVTYSFPVDDHVDANIGQFFRSTYKILDAARRAYYECKRQLAVGGNRHMHNDTTTVRSGAASVSVDVPGPSVSSSSNLTNTSGSLPCVLVHCQRGRSRSPTIVLAYLMRRNGWTFTDALQYVSCRRPCIELNMGFVEALRTYQDHLDPQYKCAQRGLLSLVVRNLPSNTASSVVHKFFEDNIGCVHKVAICSVQCGRSSNDAGDASSSEEDAGIKSVAECNSVVGNTMCLVIFASPDSVHVARWLYLRHPTLFKPLGAMAGRRLKLTLFTKLDRTGGTGRKHQKEVIRDLVEENAKNVSEEGYAKREIKTREC
uniref:protein-tyrosine-phosphatase n=1 Tax=Trypanosoma vivax (strain Y486) TaxID=1055687 RepID=G0TVY3_TRYVY|nr:putative dual-specificity protein phosphatase [Trypanosoma vivax Y486]